MSSTPPDALVRLNSRNGASSRSIGGWVTFVVIGARGYRRRALPSRRHGRGRDEEREPPAHVAGGGGQRRPGRVSRDRIHLRSVLPDPEADGVDTASVAVDSRA